MENKDIIIGILLIASVSLVGGLGFVLITSPPPTENSIFKGIQTNM